LPTYEYRCAAGHQYETRESFDAPSRQKCQKCGKPAMRVIFAPPIVFKGSGFYKTDSRGSTDGASEPASAATTEHGHTHGPGGHTHDSGDSLEAAAAS
jgi:putative FmdB family regulatory protein